MLVTNAVLADGSDVSVRIDDERIEDVGDLSAGSGEETLDAAGMVLMPGMVDTHVHLREPGFPHKETWGAGTRSAAAGGVTTVIDQPNTEPATVTGESYDRKQAHARRACVDYGINGGVSADWEPATLFERPLTAVGEVFLADSTGEMGIEPALFEEALGRVSEAGLLVTVHAEDAASFDETARDRGDQEYDAWSEYRPATAEIAAVEAACAVATEQDVRIHIAHITTPEAVDIVREAGMSCEVTPHHLLLSRPDYDRLGAYGRMNPPLRSEARRAQLYDQLVEGAIDFVATDHAPHTSREKNRGIWDAPSGVPGVETALPLLVAEATSSRSDLDLERVVEICAVEPAARFGLQQKGRIEVGRDADLVLMDTETTRPIRTERLSSVCGWTPFESFDAVFPEWTMVRGEIVSIDQEFREGWGQNVKSE